MHGGGGPVVGAGVAVAVARGHEVGTPEGVAELYDAYADGLFAYCRTLTGDDRIAHEVLHDTVVVVRARASGVESDAQLRALLYAVARTECLRHGGARPDAASAALEPGQLWRPGVVLLGAVRDRARLLPLVPIALAGVDGPEREALELTVRHGLDEAELARVLGLPRRQAARLVERGREQFAMCLRVHAVCVHPDQECAELAVLLPSGVVSGAAQPGPIEPGLRVPAGLHVDSCAECARFRPAGLAVVAADAEREPGGRRDVPSGSRSGAHARSSGGPTRERLRAVSTRAMDPAAESPASFRQLVDALVATGPARPAPLSVRAELLRGGTGSTRGRELVVARAVRAGRDGFPRTRRRVRAPLATAVAAAGAAALLMTVALAGPGGSGTPDGRADRPVAMATPPVPPPGAVPEGGVAGAGGPGAAVEAPQSSAASNNPPSPAPSSPGNPTGAQSPTARPSDRGPKTTGTTKPPGGGGPKVAGAPEVDAWSDGFDSGSAGGSGLVVLTPSLTLTERNPAGVLRLSASSTAAAPLPWSLGVSSAPWLTLSRTSGSLRPGSTVSVTATWDVSRAPVGSSVTVTVVVGPAGRSISITGPGRPTGAK